MYATIKIRFLFFFCFFFFNKFFLNFNFTEIIPLLSFELYFWNMQQTRRMRYWGVPKYYGKNLRKTVENDISEKSSVFLPIFQNLKKFQKKLQGFLPEQLS